MYLNSPYSYDPKKTLTRYMSCFEIASPKASYSYRSNIRLDFENVEELRDKWTKHFDALEKSQLERKLSAFKAQCSDLLLKEKCMNLQSKSKQPQLKRTQAPQRPITKLYSAPRMTHRMRIVMETKMPKCKKDNPNCYQLCAQCGFVKCSLTPHQHSERLRKRLKGIVAKNPMLTHSRYIARSRRGLNI